MPEMPMTAQSPSRFRSFFKLAFFGVVILGLLILLAVGFENRRGRLAWGNFRAEWEAKGERFDIASFIPKPVPPEQNFAMTPLLAPLLDYDRRIPGKWRDPAGFGRVTALSRAFGDNRGRKAPQGGNWQLAAFLELEKWQDYFVGHTNFNSVTNSGNPARDVLAALRRFDAELDELGAAAARPHSVFPVHYHEHINALLPHLAMFKGLVQVARLRAAARLADGNTTGAFQDVKLALRLAEAAKEEPFSISQLVRISCLQIALQPLWEGMAHHQWTEEQLTEIQSMLANIRLLDDYGRTIRGERAMNNLLIDELRTGKMPLSSLGDIVGQNDIQTAALTGGRLIPSGWFYQNQLTLNRLYQEHCLPLVDAAKHRAYPQQAREAEIPSELKTSGLYNIFARLLFPAITKLAAKFANGQTTADLAAVACALERHRLAHGQYPEQLDLLVPRFIAKIPTDVISGELLKYRREADDRFVLYSVGWDEIDAGGEPGFNKSGTSPDSNSGDWVWRYPSKP